MPLKWKKKALARSDVSKEPVLVDTTKDVCKHCNNWGLEDQCSIQPHRSHAQSISLDEVEVYNAIKKPATCWKLSHSEGSQACPSQTSCPTKQPWFSAHTSSIPLDSISEETESQVKTLVSGSQAETLVSWCRANISKYDAMDNLRKQFQFVGALITSGDEDEEHGTSELDHSDVDVDDIEATSLSGCSDSESRGNMEALLAAKHLVQQVKQ
ncbi:hypothetical protein L208DRAFT_1553425 [Tricholoma matsutake]|nr:hypothetical protein L208DRAFT_1553425 [Tricholoma matsutake 945]